MTFISNPASMNTKKIHSFMRKTIINNLYKTLLVLQCLNLNDLKKIVEGMNTKSISIGDNVLFDYSDNTLEILISMEFDDNVIDGDVSKFTIKNDILELLSNFKGIEFVGLTLNKKSGIELTTDSFGNLDDGCVNVLFKIA